METVRHATIQRGKEAEKRQWLSWFQKNSTYESVSGATNDNVSGEVQKAGIATNDFVRGLKFENVSKWRNNKWIETKIA